MLNGMYAFEPIYRVKVSPVSVMYHVGTIVIGQVAIAINLQYVNERDGTLEFLLCTVWGIFRHSFIHTGEHNLLLTEKTLY